MSADPFRIVAEILGEPASLMTNPANADYQCPFLDRQCTKFSHSMTGPYPVCSIHRRRPGKLPICACPNRFLEADIIGDVLRECWTGPPPVNPVGLYEIRMEKFGKVDLVIADIDKERGLVREFISVEVQAVDITGTVLPAYESIIHRMPLAVGPSYGFNWANVRKRFVSQLVAKGFYHHHWGTRIVAILQTDMFDEMQKHAKVPTVAIEEANIVFLLYQFVWNEDHWTMQLDRVVPTTHVNVMNAVIYERPPSRAAFESRIMERFISS